MTGIDTAVVDSLKVLDLKWPIREADIGFARKVCHVPGLSLVSDLFLLAGWCWPVLTLSGLI